MIIDERGDYQITLNQKEFAVIAMAVQMFATSREDAEMGYKYVKQSETRIWDLTEESLADEVEAFEVSRQVEDAIYTHLFEAEQQAMRELANDPTNDPNFERISTHFEKICFGIYQIGDPTIEMFEQTMEKVLRTQEVVTLQHYSISAGRYNFSGEGKVIKYENYVNNVHNHVELWVTMDRGTIVRRLDVNPTASDESIVFDAETVTQGKWEGFDDIVGDPQPIKWTPTPTGVLTAHQVPDSLESSVAKIMEQRAKEISENLPRAPWLANRGERKPWDF